MAVVSWHVHWVGAERHASSMHGISLPCAHMHAQTAADGSTASGGSTTSVVRHPTHQPCLTKPAAKQAANEEVHPACERAVRHVRV